MFRFSRCFNFFHHLGRDRDGKNLTTFHCNVVCNPDRNDAITRVSNQLIGRTVTLTLTKLVVKSRGLWDRGFTSPAAS